MPFTSRFPAQPGEQQPPEPVLPRALVRRFGTVLIIQRLRRLAFRLVSILGGRISGEAHVMDQHAPFARHRQAKAEFMRPRNVRGRLQAVTISREAKCLLPSVRPPHLQRHPHRGQRRLPLPIVKKQFKPRRHPPLVNADLDPPALGIDPDAPMRPAPPAGRRLPLPARLQRYRHARRPRGDRCFLISALKRRRGQHCPMPLRLLAPL